MGTKVKTKVSWEFWYSYSEYIETTFEIKECIAPEKTKVWRTLLLKFNKGECRRIGYKSVNGCRMKDKKYKKKQHANDKTKI